MRLQFKTTFVLWPRRLIGRDQDGPNGTFKCIGWVWLQRAYLVHNASLGWVAFIEWQTPEYLLEKCKCCKQPYDGIKE